MSAPALTLLLARLLWPVASVRWEAARALAGLIAAGDAGAVSALLSWIADRRLESEATIGLSVIDAFSLEAHFDGAAVAAAVRAPSVLSELLLRRNFGTGNPSAPTFAPAHQADVTTHVADYFERRMGYVVPLGYKSHFEDLEEESGLPFMARWAHEWRWLQATLDEPLSSDPYWFTWREHGGSGLFDPRQREVYLSAYLRTLAFAEARWGLGRANTDSLASEAQAGLRGLARVEFQKRPDWTQGLTSSIEPPAVLAKRLWAQALADLPSGRGLLTLRCADLQPQEFVDLEIGLVAGVAPWPAEPAVFEQDTLERPWIEAAFDGGVQLTYPGGRRVPSPTPLSVTAYARNYPRWHLDLFKTGICLAWPGLFKSPPSLSVRPDAISLAVEGREVSRFWAWHTDWEPMSPQAHLGWGGRITDIDSQDLADFVSSSGNALRRAALVRIGRKGSNYKNYEIETHRLWLD